MIYLIQLSDPYPIGDSLRTGIAVRVGAVRLPGADLLSVRDTSALDALADDERRQWRGLWDDVRRLLDNSAKGSSSRG